MPNLEFGSLPCRQLRKPEYCLLTPRMSSLPCRQLRKQQVSNGRSVTSSLPCRQLRNLIDFAPSSDALFTAM